MEPLLTDLPADVLLMVMQFLDVPDLLACRLVCKRLGGLVLHPDAWRHRNIRDLRHATQALRLAPCLMTWKLNLLHELSRPPVELCCATKCAVTRLDMVFATTKDCVEFGHAGPVIRNQAALGRLKGLKLKLVFIDGFYPIPDDHDAKLLATAVSTGSLAQLDVIGFGDMLPSPDTPALLAGPAPSASIKALNFTLSPGTEPFVSFVLAAHAATLEKVVVTGSSSWKTSDFIAVQLGALDNLRELTCGTLTGMQAVAACKSLRQVVLRVIGLRRNLLDAEEFLRRADQLEALQLVYRRADDDNGPSVLSLPARSRLQRLVIADDRSFEQDSDYPHLQPLLAALPSLTALRHLELRLTTVVLDGLAGAVTPVTAPALRTLKLRPILSLGPIACAHAYLHSRSMATLLADNPALQVHVHACNVCLQVATCEACRRHCHQELRCIRWLKKGEKLSDDYDLRGPYNYMWINFTRYNLLFNNGSQSPLIPVG